MRNLVTVIALLVVGCGSSSSHADKNKDEKAGDSETKVANVTKPSDATKTNKTRVAEAKPKVELPKKAMIPPTGKWLLKKVTLEKLSPRPSRRHGSSRPRVSGLPDWRLDLGSAVERPPRRRSISNSARRVEWSSRQISVLR